MSLYLQHTGRTLIKHTLKNIGITDEAIIEKLYSIVKNTKLKKVKITFII